MFTIGFRDALGPEAEANKLQLTDRDPYSFAAFSDNRVHIVCEGDTLFTLASRYFASFPNPGELWWIIADFQPDPIIDPTLKLPLGAELFIPSERTVSEQIFSESRRQ